MNADKRSASRVDSLVRGIRFTRINDGTARQCFKRFQSRFRAEGNYIFLTRMDFDKNWDPVFDVTILPATDQLDVVRQIGTEAGNYDLSNEAIVAKLRSWNERYPFELEVIDADRVEGYFAAAPQDPLRLAREITAFCPDVIEQGYGDTTKMVADLEQRFFWMWWD